MSWRAILAAAAPVAQAFEAASRGPRAAQEALLRRLLAANANSDFGRVHGFAQIGSIEAYRAAVPSRTASDYAPWVDRIVAGEAGVLTCAPVIAFERTSGTAAGGHLVPYTAASLDAFRDAVLPWLADLTRRRPGVAAGRVYASISPATRAAETTPGGVPIGLDGDAAYLGADLVAPFLSLLAVSPTLGRIADVETWRTATLAQLIAADDLSFVSVWSPTFLVELIDAVPASLDAIAALLPRDARARLDKAARGGRIDTRALWPMLDCISCWTDGASAGFARQLGERFPGVAIEPKGLLATEAAVTVPFGNGDAVTAVLSSVVEYVDAAGEAHLCDTLEPGATYEVVVTTPGGLYRYAIGDRVMCTSTAGGIARLRFVGRAGVTSDLVGEKLDDAFVAAALGGLGWPCVLVPEAASLRYQLWIDAPLGESALAAAAARIDRKLRANPQYDYARKMNQLRPILACARPGFMLDVGLRRIASGTRLGDVKPVGLLLLREDA